MEAGRSCLRTVSATKGQTAYPASHHHTRGNCHWFGDGTISRTLNSYSASAPLLPWLAASLPLASPSVVIWGHSPTSAARIRSGVIRSGAPPYPGPIWPGLAWFTRNAGGGTGYIQYVRCVHRFRPPVRSGAWPGVQGLVRLKGMVAGVVSNAQRLFVRNLWMGEDARGRRGRQRSPQGVRLINSESLRGRATAGLSGTPSPILGRLWAVSSVG